MTIPNSEDSNDTQPVTNAMIVHLFGDEDNVLCIGAVYQKSLKN